MTRLDGAGDQGAGLGEHAGIELPVERLRTEGSGRPVVLALAIASLLLALVWQPWGRDGSPAPGAPAQPPTAAPVADRPTSPSRAPSPSTPGSSSAPVEAGSAEYVSLVDNEWTIVALLAPSAPASTEEPSIQHNGGGAWSPGGPLLVLQQGLSYSVRPVQGPVGLKAVCQAPGTPRERMAVPLPAGRVVYLGVTFPQMDQRAHLAAAVLGRSGDPLGRVAPPVVSLSGMSADRPYLIPSSGIGAAALFATTPVGILAPATYQFEIQAPGVTGHRYLYACIGP